MRVLVAAAVLVAGCGGTSETAYVRQMKALCSAPTRYKTELEPVPPEARMALVMTKLEGKLDDPEVRAMLERMGSAEDKQANLDAAAKKAGIKRCELGEVWAAWSADDPYKAETWIAKLGDPKEAERAVVELEHLGDPKAIPALGAMWETTGRPVRVLQVIIDLARPVTKEEAKEKFLTDYEKDGRPESWSLALPFLEKAVTGIDEANPRSIDSAVKAADALGAAQLDPAEVLLIQLVTDPEHKLGPKSAGVRVAATIALGRYHDARAVTALSTVLRTALDGFGQATDETARRQALITAGSVVNALGEARAASSIPALLETMYTMPQLATQVRRALVASGPTVAAELKQILRGEHVAVNALFAAKQLGVSCPAAVAGKKKPACVPVSAMDFYAALFLGDFNDPTASVELIAALARKPLPPFYTADITQRHAIYDALRKLGPADAAAPVKAVWSDKKRPVIDRALAVAAFGFIARDAAEVPTLRTLINDPKTDDRLRREALTAVARIAQTDKDLEVLTVLATLNHDMAGKTKDPAQSAQYLQYTRGLQLQLAQAEIALHCKQDPACFGATLAPLSKTDAEQLAAAEAIGTRMGPLIIDWAAWKPEEKRALIPAQIERAMIELGKLGAKAADQTAVLLAAAGGDPSVRQSIQLALPKIAPLPCADCEAQLTRLIAADEDKPDRAELKIETTIVRNYFTWAGK